MYYSVKTGLQKGASTSCV